MRTTVQTDQELVKSYLRGNDKAFEELFNRYQQRVYTSIYLFVKEENQARDIFQDTFIKVIDTLRSGKYRDEGKFLPWVLRIAYNLCVDNFRRGKRNPHITTNEGFDIFDVLKLKDSNIQDRIILDETSRKVRHLVDQLPEEQKEVVILRHYAEMSFKEIAALTGVSINTALGRMRYALINIRKTIKEKEISI